MQRANRRAKCAREEGGTRGQECGCLGFKSHLHAPETAEPSCLLLHAWDSLPMGWESPSATRGTVVRSNQVSADARELKCPCGHSLSHPPEVLTESLGCRRLGEEGMGPLSAETGV